MLPSNKMLLQPLRWQATLHIWCFFFLLSTLGKFIFYVLFNSNLLKARSAIHFKRHFNTKYLLPQWHMVQATKQTNAWNVCCCCLWSLLNYFLQVNKFYKSNKIMRNYRNTNLKMYRRQIYVATAACVNHKDNTLQHVCAPNWRAH